MSDEAKAAVERIDVHTYGGTNRAGVKAIAQTDEKNLWMSEVDGSYTAGENAGEMSAGLGLANQIVKDLKGLDCSAWILWNLIDKHADSSEYGQKYAAMSKGIDRLSLEELNWPSASAEGSYWGVAAADHNSETLVLSMKYYALGQFSRYIRPGYALMNTTGNTVAAYDPETKSAVVVAINDKEADSLAEFDLSGFSETSKKITAIRTSGSMESGEKWKDVSDSCQIAISSESQSFQAQLKGNSITTYLIEGVGDLKKADERPLVQIPVAAGQVTGSAPWNNNSANAAANVVDGDYNTFFDGVSNGYVILDLLEEKDIAAIAYSPRKDYEHRTNGATISASKDGETWTDLYAITERGTYGVDSMVYADQFTVSDTNWRYIRYSTGGSQDCNLSELKVYEKESRVTWNLQADYEMNVKDGLL